VAGFEAPADMVRLTIGLYNFDRENRNSNMRSIKIAVISYCLLALCGADKTDQADPGRHATVSMTLDDVSLIVNVPTRNDVGKPIVASITLQNNSDQEIEYFTGDFPFDISVRDSKGKQLLEKYSENHEDCPQATLGPHAKLQKEYDLSPTIHDVGEYFVTVGRDVDEASYNWKGLEVRDISLYVGKVDIPYFPK